MNAFSKNLKFLRKEKGLRQTEMFTHIGFKQTTWNNYERGVAYPNILDLLKICDFFAVSVDDLLRKDMTTRISEAHEGSLPDERASTEIECLRQLLDQKEQTIREQTLTISALQSLLAKETGK